MADRITERDEDCPECSCDAVHGCDCEDDGEVLSDGVERLEDGGEGRARTGLIPRERRNSSPLRSKG